MMYDGRWKREEGRGKMEEGRGLMLLLHTSYILHLTSYICYFLMLSPSMRTTLVMTFRRSSTS